MTGTAMGKHTIIIGGGAMGSAIACFLSSMAASGDRVTVVERDPSYQGASSSLSAGAIRQQFSTLLNVQLSQFSWEFMHRCTAGGVPGAAVGLKERGYLVLGRSHQAATLRQRADQNRAAGVSLHEFGPAELAARFPWMRCDDIAYAAIGLKGEGWFDGYMLQQLYRTRARGSGVQYVHGNVVRLETRGSNVVAVELADGSRVEGDQFVNAGGPWSAAVARMVGVDLPVRAKRRTIFIVSCPTPLQEFPILIDPSGIFVRPEQHHFLCTVSPAARDDHDDLPLDPDFSLFEERIWPTLADRIPAFGALRVERAWAGYYEFNTADQNGLVGQIGPDNFHVATGFSGHGLMHSAGIGRGMAELLTQGAFQTLDLSPLSPRRLETGDLIVEGAVY
jgi:FAD-dependent oxidoreductase domain-containing protein 1